MVHVAASDVGRSWVATVENSGVAGRLSGWIQISFAAHSWNLTKSYIKEHSRKSMWEGAR